MCRLYGLQATHPTRVYCELLHVQNAMIAQAQRDKRGDANPHGWGVGAFKNGETWRRRQPDPAHHSEEYRTTALDTSALGLIAHLRRATVGEPCLQNTHPFFDGTSLFAHNGHIDHFEEVQPRLLAYLPAHRREAIEGTTDTEHIFQLVLHEYEDHHAPTMIQALDDAIGHIRRWVADSEAEDEGGLGLNLLWLRDGRLAGTRFDRTLWVRTRTGADLCEFCGTHHHDPDDVDFRSVEVASERLTTRGWEPVPDESLFWVDDDFQFHTQPLRDCAPLD